MKIEKGQKGLETYNGCEIKIYEVIKQEFGIFGMYNKKGTWISASWNSVGVSDTFDGDLNVKMKCDLEYWNKFEVDYLFVEVKNEGQSVWRKTVFIEAIKSVMGESKYLCSSHVTPNGFSEWDEIRLIKNKPMPWFGGDCPMPHGIKVKIWLRTGEIQTRLSNGPDWTHGRNSNTDFGDIIAFQILPD